MRKMSRLKAMLIYLSSAIALIFTISVVVVFGTGDAGIAQKFFNGAEARALKKRSTSLDKVALKTLYQTMVLIGQFRYPRAAEFLTYYCSGQGDTLRFDAEPILRSTEIQLALQHGKQAITFRHQDRRNPRHHVVGRTDWDLYYSFDLLFIRRKNDRVAFYDQYYFQPLARKSRTAFHFGKIHFKLNDGLIHVAYPEAKMFTSYGEAAFAKK